jgi:hypothetical protein
LFVVGINQVWDRINWKWLWILPLAVIWIPEMAYFHTDAYSMIKDMPDPCDHNCTIISDWSYGHIYRYYWNETVKYRASPPDIHEELYYLYYQNLTCDDCVYVIHPDDYDRFDSYAKVLHMPILNLTRHDEIIVTRR